MTMSFADQVEISCLSLRALFPGKVDPESEALIKRNIHQCNPPIRAVSESTWALKAGGLVHCAVCRNIRGEIVALKRERHGLCPDHADWKIFYRHHSWSEFEQHQAVVEHLKRWFDEAEKQTSSPTNPGNLDALRKQL